MPCRCRDKPKLESLPATFFRFDSRLAGQAHLNPYLNFHRPCGQAEIQTDTKGKQKRVYRRWATPWDIFRELPEAERYLRPGQTMKALLQMSLRETDTESAIGMQAAKGELFSSFHRQARGA